MGARPVRRRGVPTPFAEIWRAWATHRYAVHGILVPLFTVLILWSRRDRIPAHSVRNGAGLVVLGGALTLAALGHAWQSVAAHVMAVVVAAAGVALWLRGTEWTRQAAAPLAFLGFMLPLPRELVALVALPLQHFVARLSSGLLDLLHVPVLMKDMPFGTSREYDLQSMMRTCALTMDEAGLIARLRRLSGTRRAEGAPARGVRLPAPVLTSPALDDEPCVWATPSSLHGLHGIVGERLS